MKKRLFTLSLVTSFFAAFTPAHAQWKEPPAQDNPILNASEELKKHYAEVVINAFKNLCMSHISQPDQLRRQLQNARQVPPNLANMVLNNTPGQVWVLENTPEHGFHLISLMDEHYYCSTYAMAASPLEVERLFKEIVSVTPEGMEFTLLKDETTKEDNGNTIRKQSYALTQNNSNVIIQFVLTTHSTAQKNRPQATVSMLIDQI